jgi:hypothetical protein
MNGEAGVVADGKGFRVGTRDAIRMICNDVTSKYKDPRLREELDFTCSRSKRISEYVEMWCVLGGLGAGHGSKMETALFSLLHWLHELLLLAHARKHHI